MHGDDGVRVDPDAFAAAVQDVAAGVAVVAARLRRIDHAVTVTSYTWVSRDPPMLLVCLHEDGRLLEAVEETGAWSLSVLGEGARATASWLATPGRPSVGQLDRVPHHPGPVTGAPVLDGALVAFECRTGAVHPAGDHAVVLGDVVGLHLGGNGGHGGDGGDGAGAPLVRFRGAYRALA